MNPPQDQMNQMQQHGIPQEVILQQMRMEESGPSAPPMPRAAPLPAQGHSEDIYGRLEQVAQGMIEEKWDELIEQVKKIIAWKEHVEKRQEKIEHELAQMKESFSTLHQGVLGKLSQYDDRMKDVGVELKAVGKVFKDVIPTFVDNVKELQATTQELKKKK